MEAAASVFYRNTDCISGVIVGMLFSYVGKSTGRIKPKIKKLVSAPSSQVRSIDEYEQILGGSESA
jgi:hypothetical protein